MSKFENSRIPRLFELMDELNITAATLSRDLKISKGNVTDWKMGRANPSKLALSAIADYLNTTPEYLLGETETRQKESSSVTPTDERVRIAMEHINGLSSEELDALIPLLEQMRKANQGNE